MPLIEVNVPYTTKSKSGVEYTKYKKVLVDKEKAIAQMEKKRHNDIDNIIYN